LASGFRASAAALLSRVGIASFLTEDISMANRDLTPWSRATGLTSFGGRDPFMNFRREMDRLFDDFFAPAEPRSFAAPGAQPAQMLAAWPRIDVRETDQAYIVTAEAPGVDPGEIQLDLRENALVISGEKRSERRQEDQGVRYSERGYGRFERIIPFDSEIDPDRVEAASRNGVLTITLPKAAQARDRSRRIQVRSEDQDQSRSQSQDQSGESGGSAGSGSGGL
jgi:HSP20 family protein